MESQKKRRIFRVALVGLGVCLAAGLLYACRPPCLILKTTGTYCGACGFTRMVDELLHGHVAQAFRENPYMFVVTPLAAVYLVWEGARYIQGKCPLWKEKWVQAVFVVALAVGLLFTLLRNLPGFELLRPL